MGRGRPAKPLSKEDILRAQKMTLSNNAAARYLHVSYNHYKKFAKTYTDEETGLSLLEKHKNQSGKGIPKYLGGRNNKIPIMDMIEGRVSPTHFDPKKIKAILIKEKLVEEKCGKCGFYERRVFDSKVPLILNHIDGNKKNFQLHNLQFLCYNCSFLYAESPITDDQIEKMEEYLDKNGEHFDWEIDEHHLDHLKELGLFDEEIYKPGSEYISRE